MRDRKTWIVGLFYGLLLAAASQSFAQDFRMESAVYSGTEKEPFSESLTLFKAGVVYDFALPEFDEVTVYDAAHARFVLLDNTRRVKAIYDTADLLTFVEKLRSEPEFAKQRFLLNPEFKEEHSPETRWLTLTADQITYRAKTHKLDEPDAARTYRKFADWFARFNAAYRGSVHSLARLELNRALAEKGFVPEEVELTVTPKSFAGIGGKKLEIRSRHLYNKLSETDQKRIEKAGAGMADYTQVSLAEFKKSAKLAAGGKRK